MKKSFFRHFKNKFVIAILIIIALIVAYVIYKKATAPLNFETATAKTGSVVESVSVTGIVSAEDKADLAFQKSGVLSSVYKKVGDSVKRGDVIASLASDSDRASLESAEATLADMSRALTPEELAVQQASLASSQATLDTARSDALNAAHSAYVKAEGALVNYTDSFFNYPQSANPTINIPTNSQTQEYNIDLERADVTNTLEDWSKALVSASKDNADSILLESKSYLTKIKTFMSDLSVIVNDLNPGASGLTQAQISADAVAMNAGLSALSTSIDALASAQASLSSAQNGFSQAQSAYNLKLAGNSSDAIAAQNARVAQAQAVVNEGLIISPIDGIVTKADPAQGEFVSAGASGFAVQNNNFKIEANVPEADIAKVAVGDEASTTLDAYGSDADFPSAVVSVDPAETVIEGVSTYKVTLEFNNPDSRIRSGMTANLIIATHRKDGVLIVPSRAVTDTNGVKSVNKVNPDGKTYTSVPVEVGLKGSDGNIEIISGISAGDKVVTYISK